MQDIQLFHFLRPYWFLAIIPLIILLWQLYKRLCRGDNWQQVIDKHLLPQLLVKPSKSRSNKLFYILGLIWLTAIFALAGPTWSKQSQPVFRSQQGKVIILDLSPPMLAADIPPDRVERGKYKVLDILKAYSEGQTGMIVFSSEAYVLSPLTNDTNTIAALVPVLSPQLMPVSGSNISLALTTAVKLMQQGGLKTGNIILITASEPTTDAFSAAKKLQQMGYKLCVLAIGTTAGASIPTTDDAATVPGQTEIAKLNIKDLEKLAIVGGGRFTTFTNNADDINYLLKPTLTNLTFTNTKKTSATTILWRDQGYWFVLLLLILVLLMFRRGVVEEIFRWN